MAVAAKLNGLLVGATFSVWPSARGRPRRLSAPLPPNPHAMFLLQMSPGALVSFMLFQSALAASFQMMGDVFSALSAAIGAADKVTELMHRKPAIGELPLGPCSH